MKKDLDFVVHPFAPIWDEKSEILILGSFPSVKSREEMFYYGHPRNRFWKIIATVLNEKNPLCIEDKKKMLINNRVALWDVLESCEILGSSDSSIKNAKPNDISDIIKKSRIKKVFTNGKTADKLYKKFIFPMTGISAVCLPSTSPANATVGFDELLVRWSVISVNND